MSTAYFSQIILAVGTAVAKGFAAEGDLMFEMVLNDPVYYAEPFVWSRRIFFVVPKLSKVDEWDCVSATDVLLDENPDLDAFFND